MLVSNFGVGRIYISLNLLFYAIGNRNNDKLDQYNPLDLGVYERNATCFGSGYRNASTG